MTTPAATSPDWTESQRDAIRTWDQSLLVSAAAGSGKTATLAERVAHLVCDIPDPCPLDRILVLTFTEAASAEMRSRIESSLARRAADNPFAQRQLLLVGRASISTIHGFCSRVLRRNFHLAGLDPRFAILDASAAALLRRDTLRAVFESEHAGPRGPDLRDLLEWYADGDQDRIEDLVSKVHDLMGSVVDPKQWRSNALAKLEQAAASPRDSQLGRDYSAKTVDAVARLQSKLDATRDAVRAFPAYLTYIEGELAPWVRRWRAESARDGWDLAPPPTELKRLPGIPAATFGKDEAKSAMDALKQAVLAGPGYAGVPASESFWKSSTGSTLPYARTLLHLAEQFDVAYATAKHARKSVDYADLERLTLDLLISPTSGVAGELRAQYRFVLVDESQDVNEVQNRILALLSRPDNLFTVGDVKQSIYRFRLAEPDLFEKRRAAYAGNETPGRVITLAENFRSRAPLLAAVNDVFSRLLVGGQTEIHYARDAHDLRPGPAFPQGTFPGAPIELHVLPSLSAAAPTTDDDDDDAFEDLENIEREAGFVAHRLRQMIGKDEIYDRHLKSTRPLKYGDVAVLLRVAQVKSKQFASQLRRQGIPVHAEARGGLLEAQEVQDVLALLELIDNPNRDLPLATYLRSPLSLLSAPDEVLARARLAHRDLPFHQAIPLYAATSLSAPTRPAPGNPVPDPAPGDPQPATRGELGQRPGESSGPRSPAPDFPDPLAAELLAALGRIASWREMAQRRPCSELLQDICDRTLYPAYVAGLPDGPQRQANLAELLSLAHAYCADEARDLSGFLSFVRDMDAGDESPDAPSAPAQDNDVVRVMTVHRSKGLEFPVVFLPDLAKRFNEQDLHGNALIGKDDTVALKALDRDKSALYPSPPWLLERAARRPKLVAEEVRALYVAMTRAREHLVLVATARPADLEKLHRYADLTSPLGDEDVIASRSALAWLYAAGLTARAANARPIDFAEHTEEDLAAWSAESPARQLTEIPREILDRRPLSDTAPQATLGGRGHNTPKGRESPATRQVGRTTWTYPHDALASRPATASVTALTHTQIEIPPRESPWDTRATPKLHNAASPDAPLRDTTSRDGTATSATASNAAPHPATALDKTLPLPKLANRSLELSPTDRGTATHLALELLDFTANATDEGIAAQLQSFVDRETLTPRELAVIDLGAIRWLLGSDLGPLLRGERGPLYRELPIYLPDTVGEGLDRRMIRGRIDLLVDTPEGPVVVDYKTDAAWGDRLEERVALYANQVAFYKRAAEALTGKPCAGVYLAFVHERARTLRKL